MKLAGDEGLLSLPGGAVSGCENLSGMLCRSCTDNGMRMRRFALRASYPTGWILRFMPLPLSHQWRLQTSLSQQP